MKYIYIIGRTEYSRIRHIRPGLVLGAAYTNRKAAECFFDFLIRDRLCTPGTSYTCHQSANGYGTVREGVVYGPGDKQEEFVLLKLPQRST